MSRTKTHGVDDFALAVRNALIDFHAQQNAVTAVVRGVLIAAGSAMAPAERSKWIDGLRACGGIFNHADATAESAGWSPADHLAAADLARRSTAALDGFVDSIAAALATENDQR